MSRRLLIALSTVIIISLSAPLARAQFLQPPRTFDISAQPPAAVTASADFNGDGIADFAFVSPNGGGSSTLFIYLGIGAPGQPSSFSVAGGAVASLPLTFVPTRIEVADLDGDGRADMILQGDGQFEVVGTRNLPGGLLPVPSFGLLAAAAGAGALKPLVGYTSGGSFALFEDQNGSFNALSQSLTLPVTLTALEGADVDGDGYPDFVGAAPGQLLVLTTNATHAVSLASMTFNSTATPLLIQIGDVNGDGFPDAVVLTDDGKLWTFINSNAPGVFLPPTSMPLPNVSMIRLGDLNGDGLADLAVGTTNQTDAVHLLPGKPDGSFGAPVSFNQIGRGSSATLVDLNGDGRLELAWVNDSFLFVFDRAPALTIDAGPDINVTTDNTATPIIVTPFVLSGQPNVGFAYYEHGQLIGTGASLAHQFSLGTHTVLVIGTTPDGTAGADTVGVTLTSASSTLQASIDALTAKVAGLTAVGGQLDTNVGSRASQSSVDFNTQQLFGIGQNIGLSLPFLDTSVSTRASQASLDAFHFETLNTLSGPTGLLPAVQSVSSTVQGLGGQISSLTLHDFATLDVNVASRASQASVDAYHVDTLNAVSGLAGVLPAVQNLGTQVGTGFTQLGQKVDGVSFALPHLDVNVSSRASQTSLDAGVSQVLTAIAALPHTTGGGGVTQAQLDALNASIVGAVDASRDTLLRAQIEGALARGDRVAMFYLPAAKGGQLENVRALLGNLLAASGPDPAVARMLAQGDAAFARGDFRGAYDRYVDAYRLLTHSER